MKKSTPFFKHLCFAALTGCILLLTSGSVKAQRYISGDTVFQSNGLWYTIPRLSPESAQLVAPWEALPSGMPPSNPEIDPYGSEVDVYRGDIYVPDSVGFNGRNYPVDQLSDFAFSDTYEITSLRLPAIKWLGSYTFETMIGLESLSINGDAYGRERCFCGSGFKELTLTSPVYGDWTYVGSAMKGMNLDLLKIEKCDTLFLADMSSEVN